MTSELYPSGISIGMGNATHDLSQERQNSLREALLNFYLMLLNLGTEEVRDQEKKYVQITNFVAMTTVLASLLYIILSIIWSNPLWFIVVNTLWIVSFCVLYLNRTGRIMFSRKLFLVAINPILFFAALVTGPETRGENFLLISVLIPFLIFDLKNIRLITFGVVTPVVFNLSYAYLEPIFAPYHLLHQQQALMCSLSTVMEAGLTIAGVSQFIYYSRKTENDLKAVNARLTGHANELKRSNADLEQFAYVISHDLKTPVRNISCFMKLLLNKHGEALNPEAKEFVDYALSGSKRMERLIDDVLSYSRIGRNLPTPCPVNLNDLIHTIEYELKDKLSEKNASILIYKELPVLSGVHSSLMYHIFQNLIRNGIKFNKSEHPEVIISCSSTSEYYLFSVTDNGIGISKEYSASVFQMFKRLNNENEFDGTGIGLAICKKIVELYAGEIWFESSIGAGTTFYFTIKK